MAKPQVLVEATRDPISRKAPDILVFLKSYEEEYFNKPALGILGTSVHIGDGMEVNGILASGSLLTVLPSPYNILHYKHLLYEPSMLLPLCCVSHFDSQNGCKPAAIKS